MASRTTIAARGGMEYEPLALVLMPDTALRTLLIDLLHDLGFRVQTVVLRSDLIGTARTLPVAAVVAQGWALGLRLEQSERHEIEALARVAPLILIGAGQWAKEVSAEDLGAVCVFEQPFDIDDFGRQLRRCLELAGTPTEQTRCDREHLPT
jgi:DNA-binding NtrC family response regulator